MNTEPNFPNWNGYNTHNTHIFGRKSVNSSLHGLTLLDMLHMMTSVDTWSIVNSRDKKDMAYGASFGCQQLRLYYMANLEISIRLRRVSKYKQLYRADCEEFVGWELKEFWLLNFTVRILKLWTYSKIVFCNNGNVYPFILRKPYRLPLAHYLAQKVLLWRTKLFHNLSNLLWWTILYPFRQS